MAKRKPKAPPSPSEELRIDSFLPLVGHERSVELLRRAIQSARLGHAYLFVGRDGVGKRRVARHLAQAMLCERSDAGDLAPCGVCRGCVQLAAGTHPDCIEVRRPVDKTELPIATIQELVAQLALKPASGHKIAIVDDADSLNDESANCFLKTLEEPPPGSLLVLIATSVDTQLATIRSRCQVVRFDPLREDQVADLLRQLPIPTDNEDLQRLAVLGGGSVGWAMELARPEWNSFRNQLRDALIDDLPWTPRLTADVMAFVDEAGKESAAKRNRARQVIALVAGILRNALRCHCDPRSKPDEPEATALGERFSMDSIVDSIDRCIEADYHVARQAHLALAVETWLDDIGRITAGHDIPVRV